jgi:hypothetical protein
MDGKSIYTKMENFVKELHQNGTVARWEEQRKLKEVERNRRKLNRRIWEEKAIMDCLGNTGKRRGKL